jgi:hypothetical protein
MASVSAWIGLWGTGLGVCIGGFRQTVSSLVGALNMYRYHQHGFLGQEEGRLGLGSTIILILRL